MFNQRRRSGIRRLLGVLFLSSLTLCLWLGHLPLTIERAGLGEVATAQAPDAKPLVQQGLERYQNGDFQGAIQSWQTALNTYPDPNSRSKDAVTVLRYLVRAYQQIGQVDQAIAHLDQLIAHYRQDGNFQQVGRMLTEKAQAYSSLGQHRRAIAILCSENKVEDPACAAGSSLAIARSQSDRTGEAAALGNLGNANRLQGDYDEAIQYLQKSLAIAKKIANQTYIVSALNNLGNTYASLAKRDYRRFQYANQADDQVAAQKFTSFAISYDGRAVNYFEASLALARTQGDPAQEIRSLLNLVLSYHRSRRENSPAFFSNTLQQALNVLHRLPDSRDKAYTAIRLANLLQLVALEDPAVSDTAPATQCLTPEAPSEAVELLHQAGTIAQHLQDRQAASYALGRLGHVYECRQDYEQALKLTQQAQLTAADQQQSLYLWEWQAGRIFKAQGKTPEAINAYEQSVQTLKSIRGDIAIASRDLQFDFRDTVEPVYRELTELQLEQASKPTELELQKSNIESALETIDSLRLAELQNYFGDDCSLEPITKPVTLIDEKTAVFSSIMLRDRVAVILTLPDKGKRFRSQIHWVPGKSQEVKALVNELRLKLEKRSDLENTYKEKAQQVYDWLIRPFASELRRAQIETLVFIQDGILRSIPMAALYDGTQFLIEQYAIANTLSLTLVDPAQLDLQALRVLAFGLTEPSFVDGPTFFAPLSHVELELNSIKTILPGSKQLLNEDFTPDRLKQELEQNAYPVIHLATHGKFGIDSRETFLVTGKPKEGNIKSPVTSQPYNEKLTMNELYQIIRNIRQGNLLELLTLTACETAMGSDRDALGIAGISLQAGARSAVASLWQVDDQSTAQLITRFYQELRRGQSRAKALQAAQRAWLQEHHKGRYSHPGFWAALILVGNWV